MKIKLAKTENIHFIGIGGIGMSGLAIIMKGLGFKVQGSDKNFNKNLERLRNNKINYFIGHKKKNILKSTIIVVSSAIPSNNPEIKEAKEKKFTNLQKRGSFRSHRIVIKKYCCCWIAWKNYNYFLNIIYFFRNKNGCNNN